jgi:hypothetical protein
MSIPHRHVNPSQTLLALPYFHALHALASTNSTQTAPKIDTSFFVLFVFFLSIVGMWGPLVSDSADGDHGFS